MSEFKKIKQDVLNCKKCSLYNYRIDNDFNPVVGQGNIEAKIIFIGEAPGLNEAKTGIPFCGRAGKILDELLGSAGIKRKDIYITNILKGRPPQNRNPQREEIEACTPYLLKQIEIIKPEIICTLGNYSTAFIMEKYGLKDDIQGISKIHGKIFDVSKKPEQVSLLNSNNKEDGKEYNSEVKYFGSGNGLKIIPLYHPAVATYNINMLSVLKEDFKLLESFK